MDIQVDRQTSYDVIVYIIDLLFAISSQMLGPTGLEKKYKKRAESSWGTVLLTYVFTYCKHHLMAMHTSPDDNHD